MSNAIYSNSGASNYVAQQNQINEEVAAANQVHENKVATEKGQNFAASDSSLKGITKSIQQSTAISF